MEKSKQIQSIFLIALLTLMIILVLLLFLPYATILIWSAVCYIIISPLNKKILKHINPKKKFYEIKRHLLAVFFALGTVVLMVAIIFFLGFQLAGQGKFLIEEAKLFFENNYQFFTETDIGKKITSAVKELSSGSIDLSKINFRAEIISFFSSYFNTFINLAQGLAANISSFALSLVFTCFTLYFFYIDAPYLSQIFVQAIPIDNKATYQLLDKFKEVTISLFKGFFLVAFYQALAALIIFTIFGVRGSLIFAALTFFSSFIPMFGCAIIWIPLAITVILSKGIMVGIIFIVLCSVLISFLDNFLRPLFLQSRIKVHPLLIFFSILGGINMFGINGILFGPMTIILFFTIIEISLGKNDSNDDNTEVALLNQQEIK